MICKICGEKMILDDRDRISNGMYDNYYICPRCETFCIEEVRFFNSSREIWHSEEGEDVREWEVKHSLQEKL